MKYALVTASTKGIGKAIGIELLNQNYFVIFNYADNEGAMMLLKEELSSYTNNFAIVKADLSNIDGLNKLVDELKNICNCLDCIVLNTGTTCRKSFEEIEFDEWSKVMNTNVNIPFFTLQKLNNFLKDGGNVISIASYLGIHPHAISIPYSVSKAALIMLTKSMVKVYKNRKIRINAIAPGFVQTDWHNSKEKNHVERITNKIALGRFASPEEIATTCTYIIKNNYINGAVIQVDGGYNME